MSEELAVSVVAHDTLSIPALGAFPEKGVDTSSGGTPEVTKDPWVTLSDGHGRQPKRKRYGRFFQESNPVKNATVRPKTY